MHYQAAISDAVDSRIHGSKVHLDVVFVVILLVFRVVVIAAGEVAILFVILIAMGLQGGKLDA